MLSWLQLVLLALALLVAAGMLYLRWQHIEAELERLSGEMAGADGTTREWLAGQGDTLITIEVLNPIELAKQHSRLGSQLASVAPKLVRRRVYDRVASELGEELAQRGVEANVEVRQAKES